ncbi:von Willebrand factor type A domain family protein [Brugia pahangi]|uniref:VWFA domain-containing protein n=1 Tax=Brugia pahangi TaxID=6280 RepID=A0A158PR27_BRUPA|nr:unnamed protein product [Brugia pahangi]
MTKAHLFLSAVFILLSFAIALNAQISNKAECKGRPLDVIFLVDINERNTTTDFNKQRNRITDIIRYLEKVSVERDTSYGIIAFHQYPNVLLPIVSPFASRPRKVIDYINTLSARTEFDSSPAQAFELATQQFISSHRPTSNKLIILAHDGISADLIAETVEARNNLERIGVALFAIASTKNANLPALIGYTTNRKHVYATDSDRNVFFEELGKTIARCMHFSESFDRNSNINDTTLQAVLHAAVRMHGTEEEGRKKKSNLEAACKANKVDIMIALDSSGSVFNVFEDERKLVHDLISSLIPAALEDGRVQVSVIRFASSADVVIPFKINQTPNEIMEKVNKIKFTGGSTRIAKVVNLAVTDLLRWRRDDAIQIFILISDGNGHELWHVAQMAGKNLQNANVEVFAVPISRDHNLNELTLYTGDINRVYVEAEQNRFVRTISSLINQCVGANLPVANVTEGRLSVLDGDTMTDVNLKLQNELAKDSISNVNSNANSNFANSLDDLNLSIIKANNTEMLANSKKRINEIVEKERRNEESITAKIFQPVANLDLLFAIDLSPASSDDLKNQLKLATELVNKMIDKDINEERIRIAIVTFSQEAKLNLEWGKATTKKQILQHFKSIKYTINNSSLVNGITLLTQYAEKSRRPNAQLIIILISDGSKQDSWHSIIQTAKKLHELHETITYAITTSKQYRFAELEAFTRDKWKVYVDGRINQFITDTSKQLIKGKIDETDELIDIRSLPIIESIQTHNDSIDLIVLVDTSILADDDFENSKNFLRELLRSLQMIDSQSRIRILLVTFNDKAHVQVELNKSIIKENILNIVEKLQNKYSNVSVSTAVNAALQQINIPDENSRQHIFIILTDGSTKDSIETISTTTAKLQQIGATVFVIPITNNYSKDELSLYASNQDTFIINVGNYKKKFTKYILLNGSSSVKNDFIEKPTVTTFFNDELQIVTNKPNMIVKSIMENETHHSIFNFDQHSAKMKTKIEIEDPNCLVDLIFIVDTSQSVEKAFQKQLQLAATLIEQIPPLAFNERIHVAAISFSSNAQINFQFNEFNSQKEILNALLSFIHTGGNTSSVNAVNLAIKEIQERGRENVRRMIVLISDGYSQDRWEDLLDASDRLHAINAIIYAISADSNYYFRELELYTRNKWLVYVNDSEKQFLEDATISLLKCQDPSASIFSLPAQMELMTELPKNAENKKLTDEIELTRRKSSIDDIKQRNSSSVNQEENHLNKREEEFTTPMNDGKFMESKQLAKSLESKKCKYSKMDLEIILDASSSRQQVFEHQRELALSLIERLPIDADETHVAVGINSFTSVPTLRQTLGLGRDKQMVRRAIEDIKYNGGSTFTAQAVELSVQDLQRGRRSDAIQVVVLMNDGMSQDPWEKVLETSKLLKNTGAELFGVALGESIDLRELKHYIGDINRIYRDNSTERFLTDIVSLLTGGEECSKKIDAVNLNNTKVLKKNLNSQICTTPNLDIIILFDNAIKKINQSEQSISSNRYLLLDVLGSLPVIKHNDPVKITVITFSRQPQLVVSMSDLQNRESIFTKMESIKPKIGKSSYAKAINFALQEYKKGRKDARGMLIIVGDGHSEDNPKERSNAIKHLRAAKNLSTYAVDSGKLINVEILSKYTNSSDNVFNYDRNAVFAKVIFDAVEAANKARCARMSSHANQFSTITTTTTTTRSSTSSAHKNQTLERKKDIGSKLEYNFKRFEGEKVIIKEETTVASIEISKPTTKLKKSTTKRNITKEKSIAVLNKLEKKNETLLLDGKNSKEKQLKEISENLHRSTQTTSNFNFKQHSLSTTFKPDGTTTTTIPLPGCEIDVIMLIDSSGSVEKTFNREKELAAEIINRLRIGANNAHVAIVKFAAKEKVKTVWSFDKPQEKEKVLKVLHEISFSSGTTAIHTALLQAITEYSTKKGARPEQAIPLVIIFTDGFGQKDTTEAASLLRNLIPNIFAIAIGSQHPVNEEELIKIAGSKDRVFMDNDTRKLFEMLERILRTC